MTCLHLTLSKLADTMWQTFASFKDGYRFYKCEECGRIVKAKVAAAQPQRSAPLPLTEVQS